MTQDPLTLYKLIVLYMLNKVTFPMTKTQIGDYFLEKEYTSFLTLQQVLAELIDTNLVDAQSIGNRTHLVISAEGEETLNFFKNRISPSIKDEINAFFKEKAFSLRNEISILSDYYKSTSGEYEAHLVAKDKDINLVEITISVPMKETAISICDNWQEKNQEVYQKLIEQLF